MADIKRPGVYIEEIPLFPPSVVGVSTAVPAFIGVTEKCPPDLSQETGVIIKRITSMKEYIELFGGPYISEFTVDVFDDIISVTENNPDSNYYNLYHQVNMFYENGGSVCFIVSIGRGYTSSNFTKENFQLGIDALESEDEPTLILLTDAVNLSPDTDYYALCESALTLCGKMGDRFAILDLLDYDKSVEKFRSLSSEYLKYGAAYTPHLFTNIKEPFDETLINVNIHKAKIDVDGIIISYTGNKNDKPSVDINKGNKISFSISNTNQLIIEVKEDNTLVNDLIDKWKLYKKTNITGFDIIENSEVSTPISVNTNIPEFIYPSTEALYLFKNKKTFLYNTILSELNKRKLTLPPSGAIAGMYARVDSNRGVWKAPANTTLSNVIGPKEKITDEEHGRLNIHEDGGKSINAIRNYTGKGTLVMGARTLAGNDNEWKYIPVRRLFNMIEESTKKATEAFLFEPNTAATWLKVKGMIESFLFGLWQRGALAGAVPEDAYFVSVGLGKTMTQQNILEGIMNVEIGVAAVRPAEFIILKFSHKMQVS